MRKKTVTHVADTIFWYMLYFLPIILTLVQSIGIFEQFGFENWQFIYDSSDIGEYSMFRLLEANLFNLGFDNYNVITESLIAIFGDNGFMPFIMYDFSPIFTYFSYFVCVYLCHLFIDFILFIPRIAHKWLNKFTRECE